MTTPSFETRDDVKDVNVVKDVKTKVEAKVDPDPDLDRCRTIGGDKGRHRGNGWIVNGLASRTESLVLGESHRRPDPLVGGLERIVLRGGNRIFASSDVGRSTRFSCTGRMNDASPKAPSVCA